MDANFNPATATKDELLAAWHEANDALAQWRGIEKTLRDAVVDRFSDGKVNEGTENVDLPYGKVLKIKHTLNYALDDKIEAGSNSGMSPLDAALEKIENTVDGGKIIADRLVKFKPSLSITEYKALPVDAKSIIDGVLTTKPGSKSVEIVTPKR